MGVTRHQWLRTMQQFNADRAARGIPRLNPSMAARRRIEQLKEELVLKRLEHLTTGDRNG